MFIYFCFLIVMGAVIYLTDLLLVNILGRLLYFREADKFPRQLKQKTKDFYYQTLTNSCYFRYLLFLEFL